MAHTQVVGGLWKVQVVLAWCGDSSRAAQQQAGVTRARQGTEGVMVHAQSCAAWGSSAGEAILAQCEGTRRRPSRVAVIGAGMVAARAVLCGSAHWQFSACRIVAVAHEVICPAICTETGEESSLLHPSPIEPVISARGCA